ncbi:hypothetical protein GH810_06710 [Acetobacterium paludosum]|uniref:DUF4190 domain-containing protein n=1 Tax=Acetobacterium paludosum TaxID=52693 RepID=A0A923HVL2_9FIRM|nr:hypothetical protein [Acetobacterium paludosum]MBC3887997.1 hypothetical protein [Acetobacterium paludosum]
MNFEFGMKGYSFGMISLICIAANILISIISSNFINLSWLSSIVGIAGLVFAILAFINGKKELEADPSNKKAKTGKTIGLVLIILNIVAFVLILIAIIVGVTLFASML